ncbi:hypothetical protein KKF32_01760 [Patescibacteria group bacterium]|nr:hypothetical protein [Patescibacteria group bacterium]
MIKLNLISVKQHNALRLKAIYYYIENFLGLFVIAVILISITLIPINHSLTSLHKRVNNEEKQNSLKNKNITDEIDDFNDKVIILDDIQSSTYNWPLLISNLAGLVSDQIFLMEFNAKLSDHQFILKGHAQTREAYLIFKDNLIKSDSFHQLEFSLSDILKKKDIDFAIKGSFK